MGDFHQSGTITTLHNLRQRDTADLEKQLLGFSQERPLGLVLPSLYSELEGPALASIIAELRSASYLSEIVIGLDRAEESQFRHASEFFGALPQHHRILWNDGPRLRAIDERLREKGLAPREAGKGRNAWYCFGYVLASGKASAVALHDCDILTYDRALLARLLYPVANPNFSYAFCKGYYSRVADGKMNGRVSRLLITPLLRALKQVLGAGDYLDYLDSFHYPLAGEFSLNTSVLNDLRIPSDWGLEIGVLSEVYRNYSLNHICQVDIADSYDHKHQDLSEDSQEGGLSKMSLDICKVIIRKLATNGVVFNTGTIRSIKASYLRIALDFVESYRCDAQMNGLTLDIHTEEQTVELFAENLMRAGEVFFEKPLGRPFTPSWNRVISAEPNILRDLYEAVEQDHRDANS